MVFIMKAEKTGSISQPTITIDKTLEQYRGKVLFPEKLERVNKILARVGPPKGQLKETYRSQGLTPPDSNS
jgi:hypothetical protein